MGFEYDKKIHGICHPELVSGSRHVRFEEMNQYFVYILTNKTNNSSLYRSHQIILSGECMNIKTKMINGFTKKYNLTKLVYFEETSDVESAIEREKQLKNWHRDWKIKLINEFNPDWKDLSVWDEKRDAETILNQVQHKVQHDRKI